MNGSRALAEVIRDVDRQHGLRGSGRLQRIIERDLPPLITAGLIDASAPAAGRTVGRNDPCPCGSGKKYKRCHGR